jgi:hypothetical protein
VVSEGSHTDLTPSTPANAPTNTAHRATREKSRKHRHKRPRSSLPTNALPIAATSVTADRALSTALASQGPTPSSPPRRRYTATVPATVLYNMTTPLLAAERASKDAGKPGHVAACRAEFAASFTPQQRRWQRMLRGWEHDTKVTFAQRRWARKMRGVCPSCGLSSHLGGEDFAACPKAPDSDDDQDHTPSDALDNSASSDNRSASPDDIYFAQDLADWERHNLDSAQRRTARLARDACLYCGLDGHSRTSCPVRAPTPPLG